MTTHQLHTMLWKFATHYTTLFSTVLPTIHLSTLTLIRVEDRYCLKIDGRRGRGGGQFIPSTLWQETDRATSVLDYRHGYVLLLRMKDRICSLPPAPSTHNTHGIPLKDNTALTPSASRSSSLVRNLYPSTQQRHFYSWFWELMFPQDLIYIWQKTRDYSVNDQCFCCFVQK